MRQATSGIESRAYALDESFTKPNEPPCESGRLFLLAHQSTFVNGMVWTAGRGVRGMGCWICYDGV
jgi:hypothetical protein